MNILVFILLPVLVVAAYAVVVWARNRQPSSVESGVDAFRREMTALSPDAAPVHRRPERGSGAPSGTTPGTPSGTTPGTPSGTTPGTPPGTTPGTPPGTPPSASPGTPSGTSSGTTPGTPPRGSRSPRRPDIDDADDGGRR